MPMHGWQKDVLLPSNWFFKKIEWTEMSGKKRRAFEYCSEDGSLMAGHKGAFIHLLSNSLVYTQDIVACFKLFADKNGGMRVSQEEQEKAVTVQKPRQGEDNRGWVEASGQEETKEEASTAGK